MSNRLKQLIEAAKDTKDTYVDDDGNLRYAGNHKLVDATKHPIDKVAISKSGDAVLGTHKVDFDYDDDDNLVAVDSKEKELVTAIAFEKSTIAKYDKELDSLHSRLRKLQDDIDRPHSNHSEVKSQIDKTLSLIHTINSYKRTALASISSYQKQLQNFR